MLQVDILQLRVWKLLHIRRLLLTKLTFCKKNFRRTNWHSTSSNMSLLSSIFYLLFECNSMSAIFSIKIENYTTLVFGQLRLGFMFSFLFSFFSLPSVNVTHLELWSFSKWVLIGCLLKYSLICIFMVLQCYWVIQLIFSNLVSCIENSMLFPSMIILTFVLPITFFYSK